MKELEILFNILLKMGWKPYGQDKYQKIKVSSNVYSVVTRRIIVEFDGGDFGNYYNLCDVAGINSGLWQFICKNKLIDRHPDFWKKEISGREFDWHNPEYRLIESALVPEEELAEFLIDSLELKGV